MSSDAAAGAGEATLRRQRRERLRQESRRQVTGLDHVMVRSVAAQQADLELHFVPTARPDGGVPPHLTPDHVAISRADARSGPEVRVLAVEPGPDPRQPLRIVRVAGEHLDQDRGLYVLELVGLPQVDRFFASAQFSFLPAAAEPPAGADAAAAAGAAGGSPGAAGVEAGVAARWAGPLAARQGLPPSIGYLNKDYESFRQLMLSEMAVRYPQWEERNPVDLGVAIVEILAYAADSLSYYQDAVGAEAYLGTARRRISVRRHARLVDYFLHQGANARAWVQVCVKAGSQGGPVPLPAGTQILTGGGQPCLLQPGSPEVRQALEGGARVFETMRPAELDEKHNAIPLYAWGVEDFRLEAGATAATLTGSFPDLRAGQVLVLWETRGSRTGEPVDRDPRRCWPVRLSAPPRGSRDPLDDAPVTDVVWRQEDALPFPLRVSRRIEGRLVKDMTVACANVVLADNGQTVVEELAVVPDEQVYRPCLERTGLTWSVPLPAGAAWTGPALGALGQQPWQALPAIVLHELGEALFVERAGPALRPAPHLKAARAAALAAAAPAALPARPPGESLEEMLAAMGTRPVAGADERGFFGVTAWLPRADLLGAGRFDRVFVVEVDSSGRAWLRFGDGTHGYQPAPGSRFLAVYRVGNGAEGNVGILALTQIVTSEPRVDGCSNNFPASGGTDSEDLDQARLAAPQYVHAQQRCVIPADYQQIAGRHPEVRAVRAIDGWSGSWRVTFLYVQRRGGLPVDQEFRRSVYDLVAPALLASCDLRLRGPEMVPLEIVLAVEVAPGFLRSRVERHLFAALGDRPAPGGARGFFYPDNFSFGLAVYLGSLLEAARQVPGVAEVEALVFKRQGEPDTSELQQGQITIGPRQVAMLRGNPGDAGGSGDPRNVGDRRQGSLELQLRGGQ